MIKVDKQNIEFEGALIVLMAEATGVLQGIYKLMEENAGKEFADKNFAHMGRMAVMSAEELREANEEKKQEFNDLLKNIMER